MERFEQTYKHKLIYVFSIPYDTHKGLLKVGDATLETDLKPDELVPNCRSLNQAAKARIDEYTKTASIPYNLLYTELAIRTEGGYNFSFRDKDVQKVLMNSGVHKVQPNGQTGDEWFLTNLENVKSAIKAVKEGKKSISSDAFVKESDNTPIDFREEQLDAIDRTIKAFKKSNEMLWYAKMRFGKTLTALEVIRQLQYRKVIIVTHRPVVDDGWSEDFKKIFFKGNSKHDYQYERKTKDSAYIFDEKTDAENDLKIRKLDKDGDYFIYFASIQDLRGSKLVGGNFNKNNAVFALDWDLIVIDEAHEGTQTELGDNVIKLLRKEKTKVLALSGTPFNLLSQYSEDNVYTWDYVMEQKKKTEWDLLHFGDHNPYADLPQMHIFTYDLGEKLKKYLADEYDTKAFNFREFFRVWDKGPNGMRELPKGAVEGRFVHENDVISFLNMLVKEDIDSGYPFSTQEYRDMFKHTLWMVPGVKEARALSDLLHHHEIFGKFGIANVAGEGDKYEEEHAKDALELVRDTIKNNTYSITLSCGKLTTGVTVKEWTAALMLSGSYSTAAAQYMQTIFRVQSAGSIDGRQKTDCYVFDFAPDRTLKVLTETVHLSRKPGKSQQKRREAMAEFLNYCPVIAISGSKTKKYSVESMMEQIKQIYAERAVNSGFEDDSIYNDELLKLDELDAEMFNNLRDIIGSSKAAKKKSVVVVNGQGLTDEQVEHIDDPDQPPLSLPELTPEQKAEQLAKKQAKEARRKAIDILRGISIRMPLMIYGADVPMEEDISIDRFVEIVDDESWKEFMPQGVTKEIFSDFTKYYDRDVFIAAGKRIRKLAAAADKETPTRRVIQIAEIFRHFKNPDKETVLTPWRVVNMHMSDTLGGWCFFNEKFEDDTQELKRRLDEPRFVDRGEVTKKVFAENAKVLEINSKSGLYPLYIAYSSYKQKMEGMSDDDWEPADCQAFWEETIQNNIYVICKTPMAKSITKRTLSGYSNVPVNAHCFDDLANMLKNKPEQFRKRISRGDFWKKDVKEMEFDAIVGNPPYQNMVERSRAKGSAAQMATPVFDIFVTQAKRIEPRYVSMIIPARWYSGGVGLNSFREEMLNDRRLTQLYDYENSRECFSTVDIAGGLCYFLWDSKANDDCEVVNISGNARTSMKRPLNSEGDIFIRSNVALSILTKVKQKTKETIQNQVLPRNPFYFGSNARGSDTPYVGWAKLIHSKGFGYVNRAEIQKNADLVDLYKVYISPLIPCNGEVGIDPEKGYKSITTPRMLMPGEICTDSYILIGCYSTLEEAEMFSEFMMLKLPRYLLRITYSSMHVGWQNFRYVPKLPLDKKWTDKELYELYGLTDAEMQIVEKTMRTITKNTPDDE